MHSFTSASALLSHLTDPVNDHFDETEDEDSEWEQLYQTRKRQKGFRQQPQQFLKPQEKKFKHFYFPSLQTEIEPQENETKICSICYDQESELHSVGACGHRFCVTCLREYFEFSLSDVSLLTHDFCQVKKHEFRTTESPNQLRPSSKAEEEDLQLTKEKIRIVIELIVREGEPGLKCPHRMCNFVMGLEELSGIADSKSLNKMNELLMSLWLNEHSKEVMYCRRCEVTPLEFMNNKLECRKCELKYCRCCLLRPHPSFSCAEWKKIEGEYPKHVKSNVLDTLQFGLWLKEMGGQVKICPQCRVPIEKNGGCHNMYCRNCKTSFNWLSSSTAYQSNLLDGWNRFGQKQWKAIETMVKESS